MIKFPSRRGKLGNSNIWGILGGPLGRCRAWTSDFDKGTFLDVVLWIDGTPPSFFCSSEKSVKSVGRAGKVWKSLILLDGFERSEHAIGGACYTKE